MCEALALSVTMLQFLSHQITSPTWAGTHQCNLSLIWRFPGGIPKSSSILDWDFPEINHPAIFGGTPMAMVAEQCSKAWAFATGSIPGAELPRTPGATGCRSALGPANFGAGLRPFTEKTYTANIYTYILVCVYIYKLYMN